MLFRSYTEFVQNIKEDEVFFPESSGIVLAVQSSYQEVRNLDIFLLQEHARSLVEPDDGHVVIDDGLELRRSLGRQVSLVLKDEIVCAQPYSEFLLLGLELLFSQLSGELIRRDLLIARFERTDGIPDLEDDLFLLVLQA